MPLGTDTTSPLVVVTGSAGFVGCAVVAEFKAAGWRVIGIDRVDSGESTQVVCDLASPQYATELGRLPQPDAIVHLATRVSFSESVPEMYLPNVLATAATVGWAIETGTHLTFASTIGIHGYQTEAITANSPVRPDTAYAETKLLGERLLSCHSRGAVLRLAGVFGLNGPSHLGLNRVIRSAMAGEVPTLYGPGAARRNYVYVGDVGRSVYACAESGLTGTYLLGGGDVLSIEHILETVCEVLSPGSSLRREPGETGRDQVVVSSPQLPSSRTLAEALHEIAEVAR